MKTKRSFISVVDDDESIRESLPGLLAQLGYDAHAFSSAEEFLYSEELNRTDCLVLDVAMPGMTGPELQSELIRRRQRIPIIFITAQRDESLPPRLVQRGAVACLIKPFSEEDLVKAFTAAFHTT